MFSKEKIIDFLKKEKRADFLSIVKFFNIKKEYNKNFSLFLNTLKENNEIMFSKKDDFYYVPKFLGEFETVLNKSKNGKNFCFININKNLPIKANIFKNEFNALKGDHILIDLYSGNDENFYVAKIKKIIKRKYVEIYGKINDNLEFIPINFSDQININYSKLNLKSNYFAKFKITKYNKNSLDIVLDKLLFEIDSPYSDINLLIEMSNVKKDFDKETIDEASKIPNNVEKTNDFNRVNLLNELIITIDGEKTKDFDDAISIKKTISNTYILGVHIADVAYYVKENSSLDLEARNRGTSIYLIDKVIPMLPEKLSNGICSLVPNEERFTLTLEAEIDLNGKIIKHEIYPSLIKSKYRLTYNQVANMENNEIIKNDKELYSMLQKAYELSNILAQNKKNDGYIDFEIEEPIIELDNKTGKAIAIKNRNRLSSEVLIENFMVFANEVVSKTISDLQIPSIYRVHEAPSAEKIESLKSFIKILNIPDIHIRQVSNPKAFQIMVDEIKEKRFDNLIKMALLRMMQKAKYSSNNIGHFGLASNYYSHFTSPIRRYPDLLLHRIIWEVLIKKNKKYTVEKKEQIESIALHSSKCEVVATDLERKVNDVKKAEFYSSMINSIKEATIVSIHKFGMFVEFDDYTNSLIHISSIIKQNEEYSISNDLCKLILNNKIYSIGQKVNVKIIGTNNIEGKIDSILI